LTYNFHKLHFIILHRPLYFNLNTINFSINSYNYIHI